MNQKEEIRVKLLFEELKSLFRQLNECVTLFEAQTLDLWQRQRMAYTYENCAITVKNELRKSVNTINDLLSAEETPSMDRIREINEKIRLLSSKTYDLGAQVNHNQNTSSYAVKDKKQIICWNSVRDVKSSEKTPLECSTDTFTHAVRAIFRILDNMLNINSRENYNQKGETPLSLKLTGKPQFFSRPVLSIGVGLQELKKVSGLLSDSLSELNDNSSDTKHTY